MPVEDALQGPEGIGGVLQPTRAYAAQSAGSQPGDPARAAKAIVDAVFAGAPHLRLPLGADAVKSIREKLARVAADVDGTEAVATATSF